MLSALTASAQIVDGDFSNGFGTNAWQLLGSPSVQQANVPTPGASTALIESTNSDTDANDPNGYPGPVTSQNAVPASAIETALNVTLPSTGLVGRDTPTNGEAIYQTFNAAAPTTLSFAWSYATFDSSPLDSVGYVLNGIYTELESTPIFSQPTPSAYTTTTISIPQGANSLAFVAYNTGQGGDTTYDTQLYVTDVVLAPEQPTWVLLMTGAALLGGMMWWATRSRVLGLLFR